MQKNYNGSFKHLNNMKTGGFMTVTNVLVFEKSNVHCPPAFRVYYQQTKQAAKSHLSFPVSSLNLTQFWVGIRTWVGQAGIH